MAEIKIYFNLQIFKSKGFMCHFKLFMKLVLKDETYSIFNELNANTARLFSQSLTENWITGALSKISNGNLKQSVSLLEN